MDQTVENKSLVVLKLVTGEWVIGKLVNKRGEQIIQLEDALNFTFNPEMFTMFSRYTFFGNTPKDSDEPNITNFERPIVSMVFVKEPAVTAHYVAMLDFARDVFDKSRPEIISATTKQLEDMKKRIMEAQSVVESGTAEVAPMDKDEATNGEAGTVSPEDFFKNWVPGKDVKPS